MAVGTVQINLEANTAKFEKQIQTFNKKLKKNVDQLASVTKKLAAATVVAAAGLAFLTKSAINTNDEIAKLSAKLGISTEDLSALAFAADFSGASLKSLDAGLSALSRRFKNFDKGGGAAKDAFEELGIATRDSEGKLRGINDVFIEISEKLSRMPDGLKKTTIAQDIFSKSQAGLIPLLNEGASGLAKFRVRAQQLGLILDSKTAKASEKFNDTLDSIEKVSLGLTAKLAQKLLPTITALAEEFEFFALSQDLEGVLQGIKNVVDGLVISFQLLILSAKGISVAWSLIKGDFEAIDEKAKGIDETIKGLIARFDDFGKTKPTVKMTVIDVIKAPLFDDAEVDAKFAGFRTKVKAFYDDLIDFNSQFADAFINAFKGLEDALMSFVQTGKLNFKDLADSIIADILRIVIRQAIIAPLVGGITGQALGGLFGGFFAKGGRPDAKKVSIVGERGPELFVPDNAGRVIPNNQLGGDTGGSSSISKSEVTININAVDTQTGTAFLLANKDTISSIFNQNLNSNGTIRSNL